jgi:hypothetical protein
MSLRAFVSMSVFNTLKVQRFDPAIPQVYCRSMPPLACLAAPFSGSPTPVCYLQENDRLFLGRGLDQKTKTTRQRS